MPNSTDPVSESSSSDLTSEADSLIDEIRDVQTEGFNLQAKASTTILPASNAKAVASGMPKQ